MKKRKIWILFTVFCMGISVSVYAQTLTTGMRGSEVETLQKSLMAAGYLGREADGDYGSTTAKAVMEFQKKYKLPVTGDADDATQMKIKKSENKKGRDGGGIIYAKGNLGAAISEMQNRLHMMGYLKTPTDGIYGSATESAVKKLQKDYNIPISGAIDEQTLSILNDKKKEKEPILPNQKKEKGKRKSTENLMTGARGKRVAELQNKLLLHGYYPGNSDGIYGKGTEQAVLKLQKRNKLKETGTADSDVWEKLEQSPQFEGKYKKVVHMTSTAYTPLDGGGTGMTAMGNYAGKGHAAVDPEVIPLGSIVYIEGYGYAICDDIGGAIQGNIIDVGVDTLEQAYQWGFKENVKVYLVS